MSKLLTSSLNIKANSILGGNVEILLDQELNKIYFRNLTSNFSKPIYINCANGDNNLIYELEGKQVDTLGVKRLTVEELKGSTLLVDSGSVELYQWIRDAKSDLLLLNSDVDTI